MWSRDTRGVVPKREQQQQSSGSSTLMDKGILDPDSGVVMIWIRFFIFNCLISLFIDPLFFYLPTIVIDSTMKNSCTQFDHVLCKTILILRTISDLIYAVNIVIKFRTAFIAPRSRVFGRGELVIDGKEIGIRYFKSKFSLDLLSALPLPQAYIFYFILSITQSLNHSSGMIWVFFDDQCRLRCGL